MGMMMCVYVSVCMYVYPCVCECRVGGVHRHCGVEKRGRGAIIMGVGYGHARSWGQSGMGAVLYHGGKMDDGRGRLGGRVVGGVGVFKWPTPTHTHTCRRVTQSSPTPTKFTLDTYTKVSDSWFSA